MNQNMTALGFGNAVRTAGLRRRRELAALPFDEGCALAADMLRDPPEEITRMRLGFFLIAIRRISERKATQVIAHAGLTRGMWDRRIGPIESWDHQLSLTAHQREAVAQVLK